MAGDGTQAYHIIKAYHVQESECTATTPFHLQIMLTYVLEFCFGSLVTYLLWNFSLSYNM